MGSTEFSSKKTHEHHHPPHRLHRWRPHPRRHRSHHLHPHLTAMTDLSHIPTEELQAELAKRQVRDTRLFTDRRLIASLVPIIAPDTSPSIIFSRRRTPDVSNIRHALIYIASYGGTGWTYSYIAKLFSRHTYSITYAIRKVKQLKTTSPTKYNLIITTAARFNPNQTTINLTK